ncbi:predicted protein [Lichtheimia corymbifera JMRC:FSU:9682]|uniref:magnesium chelatase n=1 Tax=Lichtheimia corymbifera JMRC:FSU:9682 TaxID=1263082 RepID=A0A068SD67_9FUNG|nr:predicted protein [Lichtheimia corymbifera JMRC:FSU:9682]
MRWATLYNVLFEFELAFLVEPTTALLPATQQQPTMSKEWIQQRMALLRKQAGFAFHQDLAISILLCLMSGRDKHLVLTAAPHRLQEVAQMATMLSRSLFGFSTANVVCQEQQTPSDLIHSLFAATLEDYMDVASEHRHSYHRIYGDSLHPSDSGPSSINNRAHRQTQSMFHNDHSPSLSSFPSIISNRSYHDDDTRNVNPVSPVDFNVSSRRRTPAPPPLSRYTQHNSSDMVTSSRRDTLLGPQPPSTTSAPSPSIRRDSDFDITARSSGKLAQAVVIQRLDEADPLVQATLLELIVTKELKMGNARYTVPKPHFLVILVLPRTHERSSVSSQLLDRFFVSFDFDEDTFGNSFSTARGFGRRMALIKNEEIASLATQASRVFINIDITRYIRDIVVGVRTHPLVQGGLTARASQDLVKVTRSLATLFQRDYLTPDLVSIAASKVLGHRIRLLPQALDDQGTPYRTTADVVAEVLRVVYVPM